MKRTDIKVTKYGTGAYEVAPKDKSLSKYTVDVTKRDDLDGDWVGTPEWDREGTFDPMPLKRDVVWFAENAIMLAVQGKIEE